MLAYCQTDDDGYLRSGPGSPGYTRGGPRSPGRPRSPGPPALPGPSGVRKRKSRDDMCLRGHHVVKVGSRAVSLKLLNYRLCFRCDGTVRKLDVNKICHMLEICGREGGHGRMDRHF